MSKQRPWTREQEVLFDVGVKYSHGLRRRATRAELTLKAELETATILFEFQPFFYQIGQNGRKLYIPDFRLRCPSHGLVIEVDGPSHLTERHKARDAERTEWLTTERNMQVIRFTNDEVLTNIGAVMGRIYDHEPDTRLSKAVRQMMREVHWFRGRNTWLRPEFKPKAEPNIPANHGWKRKFKRWCKKYAHGPL